MKFFCVSYNFVDKHAMDHKVKCVSYSGSQGKKSD